MQGLEDPTSITHTQPSTPGNKFNSNEYFRADTFKPADTGAAPRPNVGDTSSRGQVQSKPYGPTGKKPLEGIELVFNPSVFPNAKTNFNAGGQSAQKYP